MQSGIRNLSPPPPAPLRSLGAPGLRAFARIAELWQLSVAEQMRLLGVRSRSTWFKWRKDPAVDLPPDTLERLSYLLGIYKALQLLFKEPQAADAWLRRPNDAPLFGGRSALGIEILANQEQIRDLAREHALERG